MTVAEILRQARAESVTLALEEDEILVDWNAGPPSDVLLAAIRSAKPELVSRLQMERRMINHWIAAHLIDWPSETCLLCRKRIVAGQAFVDVSNGDACARFHGECHPAWLATQGELARKTIGLLS
jgi:hypothetical protein